MTVCFKRRKQRYSLFVVAIAVVVFPKTVMSKKLELECRQADHRAITEPQNYLFVGR